MGTIFRILLLGFVCFVGYKGYQLYEDNQSLSRKVRREEKKADLLNKELQTEESLVQSQRHEEIESQQRLVDKLKSDLDHQERVLADLDLRGNQLAGRSADSQKLADLRSQIEYKQRLVGQLEQDAQNARQGVSQQDAQLQAVRSQDAQVSQVNLAQLQLQIQQQKDYIKSIHAQIAGARANGYTINDVEDLKTQQSAAQGQLASLQQQYEQQRAYHVTLKSSQGSLNGALSQSKKTTKQSEDELNAERRKLKGLQDEYHRIDKSSGEAIRGQDRIQDQYASEKIKLQRLSDEYNAQSEKLQELKAPPE